VAYANYDDEMREILHLLKFRGQRRIAEHVLGWRVAEAVAKLRGEAGAELVVIPVPLFAARERERGFNQAMVLAEAAVKRLRGLEPAWKLAVQGRVLSRVRDTGALYRLDPAARRRDLRGAFRVVNAEAIRGREVLLIDDIMTTGATARECSRVLMAAGAARVWVATAARAQPEAALGVVREQVSNVERWDAVPVSKVRTIEPEAGRRKTF
jgi:ComF family protein